MIEASDNGSETKTTLNEDTTDHKLSTRDDDFNQSIVELDTNQGEINRNTEKADNNPSSAIFVNCNLATEEETEKNFSFTAESNKDLSSQVVTNNLTFEANYKTEDTGGFSNHEKCETVNCSNINEGTIESKNPLQKTLENVQDSSNDQTSKECNENEKDYELSKIALNENDKKRESLIYEVKDTSNYINNVTWSPLTMTENIDTKTPLVFISNSQSCESDDNKKSTINLETNKNDLYSENAPNIDKTFLTEKTAADDLLLFTANLKKKPSLTIIGDLMDHNHKKESFINVEAMQFESEFLTRRIKEGRDNEQYAKTKLKEKNQKLESAERKIKDLKLRLIRFAKDDEAKDRRIAALEREIKELNWKIEELGNDQKLPFAEIASTNATINSKIEPEKKSLICNIL